VLKEKSLLADWARRARAVKSSSEAATLSADRLTENVGAWVFLRKCEVLSVAVALSALLRAILPPERAIFKEVARNSKKVERRLEEGAGYRSTVVHTPTQIVRNRGRVGRN
jgi:hypothetical protein